MITILGTSHVSSRSSREVKLAVPDADVVCLELDSGRIQALVSNQRASFTELRQALGLKGALMASFMRWFQEKIAKDLGVVPGVEMKTALREAAAHKKLVAVIDRPIQTTLQRLSKSFGWREIRQMMRDSFRKQKISAHPDDDLVLQLLEQMKVNYPRIYKVMVTERDSHMARALLSVQGAHPEKNILAVVGKAHVPGLIQQITYINKDVEVKLWSSQVKNANTSSS